MLKKFTVELFSYKYYIQSSTRTRKSLQVRPGSVHILRHHKFGDFDPLPPWSSIVIRARPPGDVMNRQFQTKISKHPKFKETKV